MAELSEQLGYPVEAQEMQMRLQRLLPTHNHLILVAESASEVVGWTHATEQHVLEVGRYCEILGLIIAADQRGKGIGRQLVDRIERWAAERGLDQITVRSNVLRQESHPFYERLGFIRFRTQHVYRRQIGIAPVSPERG